MLHRPQSIFLVITIIVLCLISLMPIRKKEARKLNLKLGQERSIDLYSFKEFSHGGPGSIIPLPLALLVRFLSLVGAFTALYGFLRYDNRVFQIKLGILNTMVMSILTGLTVYLSIHKAVTLLCVAAVVSNLLANHYIRKDEKFVKSTDRIR